MPIRRRDIRWNMVGTLLCLLVFIWVADAFFDFSFNRGRSFVTELFRPDFHEFLVYAVLIFFIWQSLRNNYRQKKLALSLEEALTSLDAEKRRVDDILAAIPDAVSVLDPELRITYQNPAMKALMGDHLGEFCYAGYHQLPAACPGCAVVQAYADGQPHRRETNANEQGLYVEILAVPVRDATGKIVAGIESVRDINELKRAETTLRKQLSAIEASIDGIAILNSSGEYLYLNRAHAEIYGYAAAAELLGKTWHVLYTNAERQRLEPLIFDSFAQVGGWRGEALGLKKDGSVYPQEVSLTLLDDGGLICVVRDISDRKKAEAEINQLNDSLHRQTVDLLASNQELEAFSYSLSHDLRSPLTSIYTAAQTLAELYGERLDDVGQSMLDSIRTGCEHMEELIEAMLILGRVSRSELSCVAVDLSSLAREVMTELLLHNPGRSVEWQVADGLVARMDPQLARILLENLLNNAFKFTARKEHARIEVGAMPGDEGVKIFVRDNGAGFDMRDAEQMFRPFMRLHASDDYPGTGIGLATVWRIIDRHGGWIRAEGDVGLGATFLFSFPDSLQS